MDMRQQKMRQLAREIIFFRVGEIKYRGDHRGDMRDWRNSPSTKIIRGPIMIIRVFNEDTNKE